MIEDLIKELNELKEYKEKYDRALADKRLLSDRLFEYMVREYNSSTFEDPEVYKNRHIRDTCRCCRFNDDCDYSIIPTDVGRPVYSGSEYFPSEVECKEFEYD